MKRIYLIFTSVLLLCVSAYALITGVFRSLDHLSKAENLLIIQVPISYHTSPPSYEMKEPTLAYNVKVLKDMRGRIPAGEKVVVSVLRKLSPGSRYLLAGRPATRGGKPWLLFHWELGVVEIHPDFKLATLEGKGTATQITMLLSARRDKIKKQLKDLRREKEFLDKVIPKETPNKSLKATDKSAP